MTGTTHTVVGVFEDTSDAVEAVRALRAAGFPDAGIGIISRDDGRRRGHFGLTNDPTRTQWEQGTAIGAAAGGATGLGLGLAVAAGLMPPLGPVLLGGTLTALLASAGAGAVVGTVVGGLVGLGVPEEDATYYDHEVRAGRTLVTVEAGDADRGREASDVMQRFGSAGRRPAADEARH
jgi:hypothetical protein